MDKETVFVVDDDEAVRDGISLLLETAGFEVETYADAQAFLCAMAAGSRAGCVILDVHLPGMRGLDLQAEMNRLGLRHPIVFLSAHGDIPTTVRAIRAGAVDFLTKPVDGGLLVARVQAAMDLDRRLREAEAVQRANREVVSKLSDRERDVLALAVAGMPNKEIGRRLGISHRTVEVHRSRILLKTGASTLLGLAGLAHVSGLLSAEPAPANVQAAEE